MDMNHISLFNFSDSCFYDMNANTIIDTNNGIQVKSIPISGEERIVLRKLIEDYPKAVHKEQLCALVGGVCGEDRIRNIIYKLRKRHDCLKKWLPNASQGEYRLQSPTGLELKEIPANRPMQMHSATLKSTSICVRPNFVKEARTDIFHALDEALNESHVVFLQGIGGIGKSEVAKHWALQKKKEGTFDTVIFAQLNSESGDSNIQSLIADDTVFVIGGAFRSRDIDESMEDYFHRKLAKIKQITDERTLIVIDNYDIDDPQMAVLFTGPYRLLVTTRNIQTGYDFPLIPVTEIQETEHLKSIFFRNLADERDDIDQDDPYIENLFALVSNHTLTIEIIARSLVNSADTTETLYQKISNPEPYTLIRNVDGLVERNFSEDPLTPFECIRLLFSLSRLERDKDYEYKSQVLVFMAAMPTRGIELSLFKKWGDSRIIRAKNSLVKKSWLRQDSVRGETLISMHPLIREIVWYDLEPSPEKCSILINNLIHDDLLYIDGLFHQPMEIKEKYANIANSLLTAFPGCDIQNYDLYAKLLCIFTHCAKAVPSMTLAQTMMLKLEQIGETTSWRYGYLNSKLGTIHSFFHRKFNTDTLSLYYKAETIMSQTVSDDLQKFLLAFLYREIASVLCNACYFGVNLAEVDVMEAYLDKGYQIVTSLRKCGFSQKLTDVYLGTLLVWRSRFAIIRKDFSYAEKLINQADEEFTRLSYVNTLDKATVLDIKASLHNIKSDHDKEIQYLLRAKTVYLKGFGEYHRVSIDRAIKLATAYQNNGQPTEAIEVLTHYQKIAEEMLGTDAAMTVSIRHQLNQLYKQANT